MPHENKILLSLLQDMMKAMREHKINLMERESVKKIIDENTQGEHIEAILSIDEKLMIDQREE